jgi:hypothetical protein
VRRFDMTVATPSTEAQGLPHAEKRYAEICSSIRSTDDISFKLLGFVPLVSGAAIVGLLAGDKTFAWSLQTVFVAAFGAAVTYALYRWELRNIQTCNWLRDRAAEMERDEFGVASGQYYGRGEAPTVLGRRFGKTEAEKLLYRATIAAWFLLPVVALVADGW